MTRISSRRPLGELAEILGGAVPARPSETLGSEMLVGVVEISAGGAAVPRFVSTDGVPPDAPRLSPGDTAVALMSGVGSSLLITERHQGALLGRECAALRPRTPEVTGSWIYVWTQSEDFAQQVERHTTGTTLPRLSRRALSTFTFPVPGITTQMEAQALLADFDAALAKTGQVVADLTELRRIELQLLITGLESER